MTLGPDAFQNALFTKDGPAVSVQKSVQAMILVDILTLVLFIFTITKLFLLAFLLLKCIGRRNIISVGDGSRKDSTDLFTVLESISTEI